VTIPDKEGWWVGVLGTLEHHLDEIMTSTIQVTYYYKLV
jgi:hypothetical protein